MVDPEEFESPTYAFGVEIDTSYSIVIVGYYSGLFADCAKSLEESKIVEPLQRYLIFANRVHA